LEEVAKLLKALLLLELNGAQAAAEREGRTPKFELLLADAGLSAVEIAQMLGKSSGAVSKAISRGRAARRGAADIPGIQGDQFNEDQQ